LTWRGCRSDLLLCALLQRPNPQGPRCEAQRSTGPRVNRVILSSNPNADDTDEALPPRTDSNSILLGDVRLAFGENCSRPSVGVGGLNCGVAVFRLPVFQCTGVRTSRARRRIRLQRARYSRSTAHRLTDSRSDQEQNLRELHPSAGGGIHGDLVGLEDVKDEVPDT
jgi:hypothetical protein